MSNTYYVFDACLTVVGKVPCKVSIQALDQLASIDRPVFQNKMYRLTCIDSIQYLQTCIDSNQYRQTCISKQNVSLNMYRQYPVSTDLYRQTCIDRPVSTDLYI
jgi:hypothetical protein